MSSHQRFSTSGLAPNHEFGNWREVIGDAYFNLQLTFPSAEHFPAMDNVWYNGVHGDNGTTGGGNPAESLQYATPDMNGFNAVVENRCRNNGQFNFIKYCDRLVLN